MPAITSAEHEFVHADTGEPIHYPDLDVDYEVVTSRARVVAIHDHNGFTVGERLVFTHHVIPIPTKDSPR